MKYRHLLIFVVITLFLMLNSTNLFASEQLILEMKGLAKEGKVLSSHIYGIGSKIEHIKETYDRVTHTYLDNREKGYIKFYKNHCVNFYYNLTSKTPRVISVEYVFDEKQLIWDDIVKYFSSYTRLHHYPQLDEVESQIIYSVPIDEKFTLSFYFSSNLVAEPYLKKYIVVKK